jgi:hypothetical protein
MTSGPSPLQSTYKPQVGPYIWSALLQVTHIKLQGDDNQQARLQGMSATPKVQCSFQGSKVPMQLQCHVPPQGPPNLHVHTLNPSILKSSVSLHARNQVTPCYLGSTPSSEMPHTPPMQSILQSSNLPPYASYMKSPNSIGLQCSKKQFHANIHTRSSHQE